MSADKKRVLIVANELSPYIEFTDFAKILNDLAVNTFDAGLEVRIIIPRVGVINKRPRRLPEEVLRSCITIALD